ncbi:MAG: methylated-DNA--[protein]-cysteine S-methyltransferase [Roseobacter sp.]
MLECTVETPFGDLVLRETDGALTRLTWGRAAHESRSDVLAAAARQLAEYCAGTRTVFDLPLHVAGSDLQRAVCAQMQAIPLGETVTYGDIAKALGVPAQAVGQACGANPIAIIIPCHRVMGAKGLTGFSGGQGVETKVALLRHEKAGGFLI